jgi:hypothetical protein
MQQDVRKAALISATLLAHLGISHAANAQSAGSRESQNATYRNILALESAYCAARDASAGNCLNGAARLQRKYSEPLNGPPAASPGNATVGSEYWIAADGQVALRHAKLSIIDLTIGHQPVAREDERNRIVVNGEFYGNEPIRQELERSGRRFRTPDRRQGAVEELISNTHAASRAELPRRASSPVNGEKING